MTPTTNRILMMLSLHFSIPFFRTEQSLHNIEANADQSQRRGNRLQHIPDALQNGLADRRDLLEALRGFSIRRKKR